LSNHLNTLIQLQVLAGANAGAITRVERFPFGVGRGESAHLRLTEAGVWDRHLEFTLDADGIQAQVISPALATLNDEPFTSARLRNGDTLKLGSVTLRFFLADARQRSPRARELLLWGFLAALTLAQLAVIAWLAN